MLPNEKIAIVIVFENYPKCLIWFEKIHPYLK